jgi:hypothetical protein
MGRTVLGPAIMELENLASQRIPYPRVGRPSELRRKTSPTPAHESNSLETILRGDPGVTVTHGVSVLSV